MKTMTYRVLLITMVLALFGAACTRDETGGEARGDGDYAGRDVHANPEATPSNKFTPADIAKLKWIEGTWRGMDGEKPFYERYKVEGTTLTVESLKEDGSLDGEPERFELKNGEFGKGEGERRSAASEITDGYVQFVPAVSGKRNRFRFVKQPHGWDAILEWPAAPDKAAQQKVYKMEPWQPEK
ncbi:MAG TPA: hypothetical protein VFZ23_09900 [Pyrinomonadaceae bacterium]